MLPHLISLYLLTLATYPHVLVQGDPATDNRQHTTVHHTQIVHPLLAEQGQRLCTLHTTINVKGVDHNDITSTLQRHDKVGGEFIMTDIVIKALIIQLTGAIQCHFVINVGTNIHIGITTAMSTTDKQKRH